jgi:preprotein translocase subunit SecB
MVEPIQIAVHAQYIHDFSFENPNAPEIYATLAQAPVLEIGINIQHKALEKDTHEVLLMLKLDAKAGNKTAFICELAYGGVFEVKGLPEDQLAPFLMIEAPRLLFPFARSIIADAVREGGFPPVLLQPLDFASLYQQHSMQSKMPVNEA